MLKRNTNLSDRGASLDEEMAREAIVAVAAAVSVAVSVSVAVAVAADMAEAMALRAAISK